MDRPAQRSVVHREAIHSNIHPIIPRRAVPEWKNDMQNRKHLIENAERGGVPYFEHDDAMYLEQREQLHYNVESRDRVEARYQLPSRDQQLNPPLHHPTARYRSSMLYYKLH